MSTFDNGKREEFLLFVNIFNMTVGASGTLEECAEIQYICILVSGEALRQFDKFSVDV